MALANIEIWRIQVFGRWGRSAVLGYIREAPIAPQTRLADNIAKGLDMAAIQEQATLEAPGFIEAQVAELVTRAPESQASQSQAEELCIKVLKQEMATLLQSIERQDAERPEQHYVANMAASKHGVVHVVSTATHTACGWSWGTSSAAALRADVDQSDTVCSKFMRCSMASL